MTVLAGLEGRPLRGAVRGGAGRSEDGAPGRMAAADERGAGPGSSSGSRFPSPGRMAPAAWSPSPIGARSTSSGRPRSRGSRPELAGTGQLERIPASGSRGPRRPGTGETETAAAGARTAAEAPGRPEATVRKHPGSTGAAEPLPEPRRAGTGEPSRGQDQAAGTGTATGGPEMLTGAGPGQAGCPAGAAPAAEGAPDTTKARTGPA